jgi:hypothetical protein
MVESRLRAWMRTEGQSLEVTRFPQGTRTAQDAAAVGRPDEVFPIAPRRLVELSGATTADLEAG